MTIDESTPGYGMPGCRGHQSASDFDPKWPHGHLRRGGGVKAEILRTLEDGRHAVLLTDLNTGAQWLEMYRSDGTPSCHPYTDHFLINAPAPKRTWGVVAIEWADGSVEFRDAKFNGGPYSKIIGRYKLTEGEGMEEKDG